MAACAADGVSGHDFVVCRLQQTSREVVQIEPVELAKASNVALLASFRARVVGFVGKTR